MIDTKLVLTSRDSLNTTKVALEAIFDESCGEILCKQSEEEQQQKNLSLELPPFTFNKGCPPYHSKNITKKIGAELAKVNPAGLSKFKNKSPNHRANLHNNEKDESIVKSEIKPQKNITHFQYLNKRIIGYGSELPPIFTDNTDRDHDDK